MKNELSIGLLAHVDAGKTTLAESLLYEAGATRRLGRVDHGDAFLDTDAMERERGITIFSKQARLEWNDQPMTLIDTPGHVDFGSEAERTLSVLDAAVLVISGTSGVQPHTETLWRLLARHDIPTVLFVNKTDLAGFDQAHILSSLATRLSPACLDMLQKDSDAFMEQCALGDEDAMEEFLEQESLSTNTLRRLFAKRALFPVLFGSALKDEGVSQLLDLLSEYVPALKPQGEFAARVYKVSYEPDGTRLTWMRIFGGNLQVKASIETLGQGEKVNQIRRYSGTRFSLTNTAEAGDLVAVTGLLNTRAGQGLGACPDLPAPQLVPVLSHTVLLPESCDPSKALRQLQQLGEENPELGVAYEAESKAISLQLMGEIQLEVVKAQAQERFGLDIDFGPGVILYKEVIEEPVVGIGHYEPLRHYAEAHILLEPLPAGSGLEFASAVHVDDLDLNWQRLIWQHLVERVHRGVLIGAPVTDMRMTIVAGRAHAKHTNGGDFRQATYRAIRQGLMQAKSHLLEPWYAFTIEVPPEQVGRIMADVTRMSGRFEAPQPCRAEGSLTSIAGTAPVSEMQDYPTQLAAFSHGEGRISLQVEGYKRCHNEEQVVAQAAYDPRGDLPHTPDSVFCSHGAGFTVPWDEVPAHAHLSSDWVPGKQLNYRFKI